MPNPFISVIKAGTKTSAIVTGIVCAYGIGTALDIIPTIEVNDLLAITPEVPSQALLVVADDEVVNSPSSKSTEESAIEISKNNEKFIITLANEMVTNRINDRPQALDDSFLKRALDSFILEKIRNHRFQSSPTVNRVLDPQEISTVIDKM